MTMRLTHLLACVLLVGTVTSQDISLSDVCTSLPEATSNVDLCTVYNSNANCLGDLEDGRLCNCPSGTSGALCEIPSTPSIDTKCARQKELHDKTILLLNNSVTTDININILRSFVNIPALIQLLQAAGLSHLYQRQCDTSGNYTEVQCEVDVQDISQRQCYCVNTQTGMMLPNQVKSASRPTSCESTAPGTGFPKTSSKLGSCPNVSGAGICVQDCTEDSGCSNMKKCCSNGCGKTCQDPDICSVDYYPPGMMAVCEAYMPMWFFNRNTSRCERFVYGGCGSTGNKFDSAQQCYDRCKPEANPCQSNSCGANQKCVVTTTDGCDQGYCNQGYTCRDINKPGTCPAIAPDMGGACVEMCTDDASCPNDHKCCSNGCGHTCVAPGQAPVTPKPSNKLGTCPVVSGAGICMTECTEDSGCPNMEKCCSTGCGHTCQAPDICSVDYYPPGMMAACQAYMPMWFYNRNTSRCEMFVYGGCGSTGNKFDSAQQCYDRCNTEASPCDKNYCNPENQICEITSTEGCHQGYCNQGYTCKDVTPSITPKPGMCPNVSGGMGMCVEACSGDSACPADQKCCSNGCGHTCMAPAAHEKAGQCPANTVTGQCIDHMNECSQDADCEGYHKCCMHNCDKKCVAPDVCSMDYYPPGQAVACLAYMPSWFFNRNTSMCEMFVYGGCGSTGNLFDKPETCFLTCKPEANPCATVRCGFGTVCVLQRKAGCDQGDCLDGVSCLATIPMRKTLRLANMQWQPFFSDNSSPQYRSLHNNVTDALTKKFENLPHFYRINVVGFREGSVLADYDIELTGQLDTYGQTQVTEIEMEMSKKGVMVGGVNYTTTTAVSVPAACQLAPEIGMCRALIPKWFYNSTSHRCERFFYGGCGGNDNKFDSPGACYNTCNVAANPCATTQCMPGELCMVESNSTCNNGKCNTWSFCRKVDCDLDPKTGPCRANQPSWFYNRNTSRCEMFTYGGCGGNDNRFDNPTQCYQQCNRQANPCHGRHCNMSQACSLISDVSCHMGACKHNATCRDMYKAGTCPTREIMQVASDGECSEECRGDHDCSGDKKCCHTGDCDMTCVSPGGMVNPCGAGRWMCSGVKKCIANTSRCDGTDDCGDGSDEWNCTQSLKPCTNLLMTQSMAFTDTIQSCFQYLAIMNSSQVSAADICKFLNAGLVCARRVMREYDIGCMYSEFYSELSFYTTIVGSNSGFPDTSHCEASIPALNSTVTPLCKDSHLIATMTANSMCASSAAGFPASLVCSTQMSSVVSCTKMYIHCPASNITNALIDQANLLKTKNGMDFSGCTRTTGNIYRLDDQVRIDMPWQNDFYNPSSFMYKQLSRALENTLKQMYTYTGDMERVVINSFSPGSVIGYYTVEYFTPYSNKESLIQSAKTNILDNTITVNGNAYSFLPQVVEKPGYCPNMNGSMYMNGTMYNSTSYSGGIYMNGTWYNGSTSTSMMSNMSSCSNDEQCPGMMMKCCHNYCMMATNDTGGTCFAHEECSNGGTCYNSRCLCAPGYEGTFCHDKPDPCSSNPCGNGGSCMVDRYIHNNYTCNCFSGSFGEFCQYRVCDMFSESICQSGGQCMGDLENGVMCNCTSGTIGLLCEKSGSYEAVWGCEEERRMSQYLEDALKSRLYVPLNYNAVSNLKELLQKVGKTNFVIPTCDTDNPSHYTSPSCKFDVMTMQKSCYCVDEYGMMYGYQTYNESQLPINCKGPCEDHPCENGGTCHRSYYNLNASTIPFFCSCEEGYKGDRCEQSFCSMLPADPCAEYGGRCSANFTQGRLCDCSSVTTSMPMTGVLCDVPGVDSATTQCQKTYNLSVVTERFLNGSLTLKGYPDSSRMLRRLLKEFSIPEIMRPVCDQYGLVQKACVHSVENMTMSKCFCTDNYGDKLAFSPTTLNTPPEYCPTQGAVCQPGMCVGNSSCYTGTDRSYCHCSNGYQGQYCEKYVGSVCDQKPCQNGFECTEDMYDSFGYSCNCSYQWGRNCDTVPMDYCFCPISEGQRCVYYDECNGVRCVPKHKCVGYTYSGPCDRISCSNHGRCVEKDKDYYCKCNEGYSGQHCYTNNAMCDMLGGADVCGMGECVGNIEEGELCSCAKGFRGAFCELYGTAVTKCEKQADLYKTALGILRGNVTVPGLTGNASMIIQYMLSSLGTNEIPETNCTAGGDYAPQQCAVDLYTMGKRCYCVNSAGVEIYTNVTMIPGQPACTSPDPTDVAKLLCSSEVGQSMCLNGGTCVGEIDSTPKVCQCAPGYEGIMCERMSQPGERPEEYSMCTFMLDNYRMMESLLSGNLSITVMNITINREMLMQSYYQAMMSGATGSMSFPITVPGMPDSVVQVTNSTGQTELVAVKPSCTESGKFDSVQCEYGMMSGQRAACFCYTPEGKIVPGTRTMFPAVPDCSNVTSSCDDPVCPFNCTHGFRKNILGCEVCQCKDPCEGRSCPQGKRCAEKDGMYMCVTTHKRGMCPLNAMADMESLMRLFEDTSHSCDMTCQDDASCPDDMKCCGACGNQCVQPFFAENCFEKRELMQKHWDFYHNVSSAMNNSDMMSMANRTFPAVLHSAISWLKSTTKMWRPMCTTDGNYERVQCEHDVTSDRKVNCFCADKEGHRINGSDTHSNRMPACTAKPGHCEMTMPGDDMTDVCYAQCQGDFDCYGSDKCCVSGCSAMCRRSVNDTIADKAEDISSMFRDVCSMYAQLNFCQHGSQCVGDWSTGDLCQCMPGYRGPFCDIMMGPDEDEPTLCEKRRGIFNMITNPINMQIKVILIQTMQSRNISTSVIHANCTEDGHFTPAQCDLDLNDDNEVEHCYCVNQAGVPIPGSTVNGKWGDRPHCGAPTCEMGAPLYSKDDGKPVMCGHSHSCPAGYQCRDLAYGHRACCLSMHGHDNLCQIQANPGQFCSEAETDTWQDRFYYNRTLGQCVTFRYRGCYGNGNNFETENLCRKACSKEAGSDKAGMCPRVTPGVAVGQYCPHSCDDDMSCPDDKKCCQTNCGRRCIMPKNDTLDICEQPKHPGPCKAYYKRFYFNKQNGRCEEFVYGGCQANDNNFETMEECCRHCSTGEAACKPGECPNPMVNYLMPCGDKCFSDGECPNNARCCSNGCGRECMNTEMNRTMGMDCHHKQREAHMKLKNHKAQMGCPIIPLPRCKSDGSWKQQQCLDGFGICWCVDKMGKKIQNTLVRGFANCEEYSQAPPSPPPSTMGDMPASMVNDTEWETFQVCPMDTGINCCSPTLCQMHRCPGHPEAVCRVNPCNGCSVEWFNSYNQIVNCSEGLSTCERHQHRAKSARLHHAYSRMPSPMTTNFTKAMREMMMPTPPEPVSVPAKCQAEPDTGRCRAYKPKWYYNHETNRCEKFIWGGCGGNDNKFETVEECYKECQPQANPCELHQCGRDQSCALEVDMHCDHGTCSHWAICRYNHDDPHMTGVDVPNCLASGDYNLQQCHHGYCWCVNRMGQPIESSLTMKYNLVCNNDGSFEILDAVKKVTCANDATPKLSCVNSCMDKTCPLRPNATCVVSLCDATCRTSFVENGQEVDSCGDPACDLYFARPTEPCPEAPAACQGPGTPRVCPDVCKDLTCNGNPCATCTVDPCSCEVTFLDMLTNKPVTDCKTVTHSLCEMDMCRQKKLGQMTSVAGESDVRVPQCTSGGHYEPQQCHNEACVCVNGVGQAVKVSEIGNNCVWNETVTVAVTMKFDMDFNKVKGKEEKFIDALKIAFQELTGIPDAHRYIKEIKLSPGSVIVETVLEDPDNTDVPAPEVPLMGDMLQNLVRSGQMTIEYEGETVTANQDSFGRFDRFEQINPTPVVPTTTQVPREHKPALQQHEIIIIAVVSAVVGVVLLGVICKCCCCRDDKKADMRPHSENQYNSGPYMVPEKTMNPTMAVSNATYDDFKHPINNQGYVADPDFIKVRL